MQWIIYAWLISEKTISDYFICTVLEYIGDEEILNNYQKRSRALLLIVKKFRTKVLVQISWDYYETRYMGNRRTAFISRDDT